MRVEAAKWELDSVNRQLCEQRDPDLRTGAFRVGVIQELDLGVIPCLTFSGLDRERPSPSH